MSKIKKEKDKNKKTQQLETSGERERSKARSEARLVLSWEIDVGILMEHIELKLKSIKFWTTLVFMFH